MSAERDHYTVLGISPRASDAEIKAAYRQLARKYHPDVNPGDARCEELLKEINTAYSVVGNAEKRKAYDASRLLRRAPSPPPSTVRARRVHDPRVASAGFSPSGVASRQAVREQAHTKAQEISREFSDSLHEKDAVVVNGARYSLRRVKFARDGRLYRTKRLIIVRQDAVMESINPSPKQLLRRAGMVDGQLFLRDAPIVAGEFSSLALARKVASQIADDLTQLTHQAAASLGAGYELKSVEFRQGRETFHRTVLCKGKFIFSAVAGEPQNAALIFAPKAAIKELGSVYSELHQRAAQIGLGASGETSLGLRDRARYAAVKTASSLLTLDL